uniref:Protein DETOXIFICATION 14-like n=1 Tax=Nicotiana tabacum TaxID=4097 RepID=A0A1S3Z1J0_TOBAC|nr:PREDICTED: protein DETOXIFICATION 14-like [Nicotiana tabacum]
MASGLETLCGQAYGADQQYNKLGIYTTGAIISLLMVCIPISVLWLFVDKILIFMGQDPLISIEASKYSIWLIAAVFPFAILQALIRYLQTQSLNILPMVLMSSVATLCFHVPIFWLLIFKLNLGSCGASGAIGLSYWFNVLLLGLYVKYSSSCKKTRGKRFSALNADEDLEMANVYVMFPMKRLNSLVSAADLGALFLTANSVAKRVSFKRGKILPECTEFAVDIEEPKPKYDKIALPKLKLEDIEEFSTPEFKHMLLICRSKKPLLETIVEESVCSR